jgi:hypothetical protein
MEVAMLRKRKEPKKKSIALFAYARCAGVGRGKTERVRVAGGFAKEDPADLQRTNNSETDARRGETFRGWFLYECVEKNG